MADYRNKFNTVPSTNRNNTSDRNELERNGQYRTNGNNNNCNRDIYQNNSTQNRNIGRDDTNQNMPSRNKPLNQHGQYRNSNDYNHNQKDRAKQNYIQSIESNLHRNDMSRNGKVYNRNGNNQTYNALGDIQKRERNLAGDNRTNNGSTDTQSRDRNLAPKCEMNGERNLSQKTSPVNDGQFRKGNDCNRNGNNRTYNALSEIQKRERNLAGNDRTNNGSTDTQSIDRNLAPKCEMNGERNLSQKTSPVNDGQFRKGNDYNRNGNNRTYNGLGEIQKRERNLAGNDRTNNGSTDTQSRDRNLAPRCEMNGERNLSKKTSAVNDGQFRKGNDYNRNGNNRTYNGLGEIQKREKNLAGNDRTNNGSTDTQSKDRNLAPRCEMNGERNLSQKNSPVNDGQFRKGNDYNRNGNDRTGNSSAQGTQNKERNLVPKREMENQYGQNRNGNTSANSSQKRECNVTQSSQYRNGNDYNRNQPDPDNNAKENYSQSNNESFRPCNGYQNNGKTASVSNGQSDQNRNNNFNRDESRRNQNDNRNESGKNGQSGQSRDNYNYHPRGENERTDSNTNRDRRDNYQNCNMQNKSNYTKQNRTNGNDRIDHPRDNSSYNSNTYQRSNDSSNNDRRNAPEQKNNFGERNEADSRYNHQDWTVPLPRNERMESAIFGSKNRSAGINFTKHDEIEVNVIGEDVPNHIKFFDDIKLTEIIRSNIKLAGYEVPTPLQKYALPLVTAKRDLMACAQTGSGKTAAYLIPILNQIYEQGPPEYRQSGKEQKPLGIVLAPTPELATRIYHQSKKFAYRARVRPCVAYGGTTNMDQLKDLERGCQFLVVTPFHLNDLIDRGYIGLEFCRYVILDEADLMLDMGFESEIRRIMRNASMPRIGDRQTLIFADISTYSTERLARDFLDNFISLTLERVGSISGNNTQSVVRIDEHGKKSTGHPSENMKQRSKSGRRITFPTNYSELEKIRYFDS